MPTTIQTDDQIQGLVGLLEALNCGALVVDRAGRVVHANARLCDMLGFTHDDVIDRTLISFYADPQAGAFLRERMTCFDSAHEGEFYVPRADGGRIPVIFSGRPLGTESAMRDFRLITVIDLSGQKKAEARIQEEYQEIARLSDTVLEQALDLKRYSHTLEERVRERTAELHDANMEAIYMLAVASEAKDADTGAHVRRIENYTRLLAREMGMDDLESEQLGYSAILHDVGKMLVPDRILKKPGPLDSEERSDMQLHAVAGERILSKKPFFETARLIARSHHENWDGSGYPDGLSGAAIPLPARIVHLADVYDALTSVRVYKKAWSREEAAKTILDSKGSAFDPDVVSVFKSLVDAGRFEPFRT